MTNRVIVITGASEGIGAELARQLAASGDKLILAARSQARLEAVAAECSSIGLFSAVPVPTDVTDRKQVENLLRVAHESFGHLDVWVNNAGQGIVRPVMELTGDDIDRMMSVNVKSALYGMQTAVRYFQQRSAGHVINVSSFLGRVPLASPRSAYNASKHALNSLTANLRMDLRASHPDIHVSLVMPGAVKTDFSKNALHYETPPGGFRPLPTAQAVEEVAAVIVDVIEHPRPEAYTNPGLHAVQVQRYYTDVAAFEESLHNM